MKFTKMEGAGNDYVYINCFEEKVENPSELSKKLSERHFGIGADGLILIMPSETADVRMVMYNSDGSEGAMCGNGIRCLAKYAYEKGIAKKEKMRVETKSGIRELELHVNKDGSVDEITVDMGLAILGPPSRIKVGEREYGYVTVNVGNPHTVIFVSALTDEMVLKDGSAIEKDSRFPDRTNVEFVSVIDNSTVIARVWERGSGETLACGSGACAIAVAGFALGKLNRLVTVQLPGGSLFIKTREDGRIFMRGPVREVFSGEIQ